MSDVVETRANADFFEVSPSKPIQNAQAQEQEVNDYSQFLVIEYAKFRKYNIILEAIQECIEDENNLDSGLRTKLNDIVLSKAVPQKRLGDSSIEDTLETVLGVPLSTTELTYSESSRLHSFLKLKLDYKCAKLKTKCYLLFDNKHSTSAKSESPLNLSQDDAILLDYRNKLALEQEAYSKYLKDMLGLLEELKNIRLDMVPDTTDRKYEECNVRTHINYLKSQLARSKYRIDIFAESKDSLTAYTNMIQDLKEQQDELLLEIQNLKELKMKYAEVSCKEYDDILKSYLQYKSSIEKKKMMYKLYGS